MLSTKKTAELKLLLYHAYLEGETTGRFAFRMIKVQLLPADTNVSQEL